MENNRESLEERVVEDSDSEQSEDNNSEASGVYMENVGEDSDSEQSEDNISDADAVYVDKFMQEHYLEMGDTVFWTTETNTYFRRRQEEKAKSKPT
jgi:hypothetical protein